MSIALVFPGQGSQSVGMGKDLAAALPEARHLIAEVDDALRQRLSDVMFEGPDGELVLTKNAQPALMAVSLAVVRVLEKSGFDVAKRVAYVAGHSLGEYSALAAVGTLTVADTARLLRTRGQAMQDAVPVGVGAMAALLGIEWEAAREVSLAAAQGQVCAVANDNGGGQVVVSGHREAVERAIVLAKEEGAKRGMLLPVSAPFHCPLMAPAAKVMGEALAAAAMRPAGVPVVANVTADQVVDPAAIRTLLVEQITATVRWREIMLFLRDHGVSTIVEIGSGKVLSGLVKRVVPDIKTMTVGTPADIDAFFKSI
ncbi:MAG: [acyl-carrier-protein] S-malonyltransferase [Alphaproteobacteria bacterium]|nr:[acyl-carrier-protein] S-malonyltransferase [Alphaproteobacteria bacterium]